MKKTVCVLMLVAILSGCSFGASKTYTVNGEEVTKKEFDAYKKQMQKEYEDVIEK